MWFNGCFHVFTHSDCILAPWSILWQTVDVKNNCQQKSLLFTIVVVVKKLLFTSLAMLIKPVDFKWISIY